MFGCQGELLSSTNEESLVATRLTPPVILNLTPHPLAGKAIMPTLCLNPHPPNYHFVGLPNSDFREKNGESAHSAVPNTSPKNAY